jgi:hypothetical protein
MIRNNYHSIHLNTAMSLNMVFVLEQVAAQAVAFAAFAVFVAADILRIAVSLQLQDNNLYMDILEVHSNNTFILSPFFLNIFKGENECDILYI